MGNGSKKNAFLVQGSILAVASIGSRLIGLAYRIVVNNILGDVGCDYYSCAFAVYSIMLTISSYSLPLAVSKLVSARVVRKENKNANRILKGALLFGLASGLIVALICFFGADFITTNIMNTPMSAIALRVLAPTLIIVAVMGVLRGYFQGLGTMIPTATSQILEQIINACGSIFFAITLSSYGFELGQAINDAENYKAAYGAAGSTLGTSVGALVGLLFLLFILFIYRPVLKRGIKKDPTPTNELEDYSKIIKVLVITIVPVLLSTTVYQLSDFIDQAIYKKMMALLARPALEASVNWGIYSGRVLVLISIPTTIANAMSASVIPSLTAAVTEGNMTLVKQKIKSAIRFIAVVSFPCAVGMGVLASPILQLLFRDSREMPALLVTIASIEIIFYTMSTLTNGILQGIDKMMTPVKNAVIALVLHVVVLVFGMFFLDLNIYAVVISNIAFPLIVTVLNASAIKHNLRYKQEIRKTFIIPGISAVGMGIIVWGSYTLIQMLCKINAISTLVSIVLGALVYFVLLLGLKGFTKEELLELPKGHLIYKLATKLRLMK